MKKIILNLLFALITTLGYSQVPNYVPTNGLVGWWPFNGNANDESGNGNNGIVMGPNLTSDRFGNNASAFDFNYNNAVFSQQNQEVYIPYNPMLNVPNITVSYWIFARQYFWSGNPNLSVNITRFEYGYSNPNGQVWGIGYNDSQILGGLNGPSGGGSYTAINSTAINLNSWNNIVMTYDGSAINLYMNSILIASMPHNLSMNISGNSGISIGENNSANGYWQYTDGKIDDIGIWNRALTACEIQNLYTSQINSTFVTAGADQTICNGEQVTLSASNSQNYSWNNGVIDSVSFSPTTTQDYIVTADSANCQSSDTVTVFVNESTSSTQSQTSLDTYTWSLNNQTYTQGGTYTATIPNAAGCDSVVTLNLTLNYTGINELIGSRVSISPNPTSSKITVKSSLALVGKEFTIYDQQGKAVKSGVITAEETEIDLSNLSEGIYLFKAGAELPKTFKIIKQ